MACSLRCQNVQLIAMQTQQRAPTAVQACAASKRACGGLWQPDRRVEWFCNPSLERGDSLQGDRGAAEAATGRRLAGGPKPFP